MKKFFMIKKAVGLIVLMAMFLSDFPAGIMLDAMRDHNVVDSLWWAYQSENVVDVFTPEKAYAAEFTIDGTVNATTDRHQKSGKQILCISDQTCYTFYINSDSDLEYQKSTDGGTSWPQTSTQIHADTFNGVSVWYDQWTPGDSGTLVHLAYIDASPDILRYAVFDTFDDSFTSDVQVPNGTSAQGTISADNEVAVTKGTDGDIYIGTVDETAPTSPASFIHKCSSSCTTAGNWSAAGSNPWDGAGDDTDGEHGFILLPLSDTTAHDVGDIMLVSYDIGDSSVEYKIYDDSGNSWSTNFTDIQTSVVDNQTWQHALGGTVNPNTGDLYITYVPSPGTANTSEVRAWKYSDGWSQLTDPWPDTTDGASIILDANVGIDTNTNDLYVVYIRDGTNDAVANNDVYYAVSTDDGSTWSTDNLLSSGTDRDHRAVSINANSNARLYAIWNDTVLDDIFGNTVADLFVWGQEAYRFFNNADGTDVGSALAAQDIAATLAASGDAFRLRLLLHNTGQAPLNGENLKLQFATMSGVCDTAFVGETYADVTAATVIAYNNNATPVDGDNLTPNGNDPTVGHAVVNQNYEEANNFTNTVAAIPSGQDGKWDFSLKDNSASAGTSYCFRVRYSNDTNITAYTVIPEIITAAGGNSPPTVSNIIVNGASAITLIENTTTTITATGTITDTNGNADIKWASSTFYRSSVGSNCSRSDLSCYKRGTSSCTLSSCTGNTCTATCEVYPWYFADATDASSSFSAQDWLADITATDNSFATGTATAAAGVEMNTLLAITVTASINYGSVNPTATSSTQIVTITNTGNYKNTDANFSGVALESGGGSIAATQQKYSTTTTAGYEQLNYALSTTPTFRELNITSATSSSSPSTQSNYWAIKTPGGTPAGTYTGTTTITAQ